MEVDLGRIGELNSAGERHRRHHRNGQASRFSAMDFCTVCQSFRTLHWPRDRLYGVPACRRCRAGLAVRRYGAFALDFAWLAILEFVTVRLIVSAGEAQARHGQQSSMDAFSLLLYAWWGGHGIRTSMSPPVPLAWQLTAQAASIAWLMAFAARDGLSVRSPGKHLFELRVVRLAPMAARIRLRDSVMRQLPVVVPWMIASVAKGLARVNPSAMPIAILAGAAALVSTLILAIQLAHGPRRGDARARTCVIWAHRIDWLLRATSGLHCARCGYNLQGNVSGICPECGTAVERRRQTGAPSTGHRESGKR